MGKSHNAASTRGFVQWFYPPQSGYGTFSNTTVGDSKFLPPEYRGGWNGQTAKATERDSYRPQEKATPQRAVGGKFFDSTDGKCSTVSAQDYDEQIEREVAENIIDWWISKKSYKQWYADKFLQHTLDFGQE